MVSRRIEGSVYHHELAKIITRKIYEMCIELEIDLYLLNVDVRSI